MHPEAEYKILSNIFWVKGQEKTGMENVGSLFSGRLPKEGVPVLSQLTLKVSQYVHMEVCKRMNIPIIFTLHAVLMVTNW